MFFLLKVTTLQQNGVSTAHSQELEASGSAPYDPESLAVGRGIPQNTAFSLIGKVPVRFCQVTSVLPNPWEQTLGFRVTSQESTKPSLAPHTSQWPENKDRQGSERMPAAGGSFPKTSRPGPRPVSPLLPLTSPLFSLSWKDTALICLSQPLKIGGNLFDRHPKFLSVHNVGDSLVLPVTSFSLVPDAVVDCARKPVDITCRVGLGGCFWDQVFPSLFPSLFQPLPGQPCELS